MQAQSRQLLSSINNNVTNNKKKKHQRNNETPTRRGKSTHYGYTADKNNTYGENPNESVLFLVHS